MRILTLLGVVLLVSCVSPKVSVSGQFSDEDIRQITSLVERRPGFKKPIRTIARDRRDHAIVQTGRCFGTGDYCVSIPLTRRHGKWQIDEERIEEEHIIISNT
jgi:hypothetical protein